MKNRDKVIDLMASFRGWVTPRVRKKIDRILTLSEEYRSQGKQFTFGANQELDREVNKVLVELSDTILAEMDGRAWQAAQYADEDADKDTILAYIHRDIAGETLQDRTDRYLSHLKWYIEGWLAIGFYNSLSSTDILADIFTFVNAPATSDLWKSAKGEDFASEIVQEGGYHYGKGILSDPIKGITQLGKDATNTGFQIAAISLYGKQNAIGYTIERGSDYDCPLCDSYCGKVYALDDIVVPIHPNCCCITTPVYEK